MNAQPSLFDGTSAEFVTAPTATTLQARFEAFHGANPWVYRGLVRLARELRASGHTRLSIGMLFEVLRYRWLTETTNTASSWKLNNSYRSRYARLIMTSEPDLADAFETRELHAA